MTLRLLFLVCVLAVSAPDPVAQAPVLATHVTVPMEEPVRPIALAGPLASREAEISGMAWYGDTLILLPQYPGRFEVGVDTVYAARRKGARGAVFALARTEIEAYLAAEEPAPLRPRAVPFEAVGVPDRVIGFEGYEAVAIYGDRVFMTVEFEYGVDIQGYLVAGTIEPGLGGIRLDAETLTPLPAQTRIGNLSYETLLLVPDGILALQEANGAAVNPSARAYVFEPAGPGGAALTMRDSLRVPTLEYRLTDATTPDASGRFWALNYFYSGDEATLKPATDSLTLEYGTGRTHWRFRTVERLVEMRYTGARIVRTPRPPILLELLGDDRARNWEGIARLGERGFLVATDRYPETIFAFVPAAPAFEITRQAR